MRQQAGGVCREQHSRRREEQVQRRSSEETVRVGERSLRHQRDDRGRVLEPLQTLSEVSQRACSDSGIGGQGLLEVIGISAGEQGPGWDQLELSAVPPGRC